MVRDDGDVLLELDGVGEVVCFFVVGVGVDFFGVGVGVGFFGVGLGVGFFAVATSLLSPNTPGIRAPRRTKNSLREICDMLLIL
ncbi:MAG: hypothetical protein ACO3S0_16045 [bacterium]